MFALSRQDSLVRRGNARVSPQPHPGFIEVLSEAAVDYGEEEVEGAGEEVGR